MWGAPSGGSFLEVPDISSQDPSLLSLTLRSEFPQKCYWWFFQTVPGESPLCSMNFWAWL